MYSPPRMIWRSASVKKQGKKKTTAEAPAKGMSIDTILENLADLKDIATSLQTPRDDPEPTQSRVAACEAATDILTALQDEGIKDPEQVRDLIHDYNAQAETYRTMHQQYEAPEPIKRLGNLFLCPACKHQVRHDNPHCWYCGKRLGWGR